MSKIPSSRIVSCEFVGSYFAPDQLPEDPRPQIAFAGRSNVGKSTLLNALVGRRKIAKVSSSPGKTRSVNFFLVNDRYFFVDLPGYGYAKVSKQMRQGWRRLIESYLTRSRRLIGLVVLLDCRRDLTEEDRQLVTWLADRNLPVLAVVTKADKLGRDRLRRKVAEVESGLGVGVVAFSAMTGEGRKQLQSLIHELVEEHFEQART